VDAVKAVPVYRVINGYNVCEKEKLNFFKGAGQLLTDWVNLAICLKKQDRNER